MALYGDDDVNECEEVYEGPDRLPLVKQELPPLARALLGKRFTFDEYGYAHVLEQRILWYRLLDKKVLYYIIRGVTEARNDCVWVDTEDPIPWHELLSDRAHHLINAMNTEKENHKMEEYTIRHHDKPI